ncbi:Holiday-junction resolvase, putative [Babesia ovis]|uniref:Holiday-junction resolvase, putative n=1 Tax=Babesia ovis TaxID=5869 RepID=A0A9W5T9P2_BABOV|nr:Holiday-junction resolvase, putative [Babesia ovis]
MSPANPHVEILRRTKFAQNRTAYNTLRNALLYGRQRSIYLVEPYDQVKHNRQLIAIKKAFASRRNGRKGPFQRLLPPHVYSNIFGDPTYYSNNELCKTCVMAAEMQLADRHFWWQIAEKLRKVRDVMQIGDVLRCLESLVSVKYFDRDLLRLLSREFADDMRQLNIPEIAQLLQCYARVNVYSVDLVNSAGDVATGYLMEYVKRAVPSDTPRESDDDEGQRKVDPSNWPPMTLGVLAKCFHMFGYKNRDLYLSIAYMGIKQWPNLDLYGKCALFANLDPTNFNPEGISDSMSLETAREVAKETTMALVKQLRNISTDVTIKRLDSITDEVDFTTMVPGRLAPNCDDYVKAMHSLCCCVGAVNNLAKVICRLVDIGDVVKRMDLEIDNLFDELMHKMATIGGRLMTLHNDVETEAKTRKRERTALSVGDRTIAVPIQEVVTTFCPYISAARHIVVDAILRAVCAVNAVIRQRVNPSASKRETVPANNLKLTVEDGNIHSSLYKSVATLQLTANECDVLSIFMGIVNSIGCSSQEPEFIATAMETVALVSHIATQLPHTISDHIQATNDTLSLEAMKNLVCFGDEARYRIMLALRIGKATPNVFLEHGIHSMTKYMRKKKTSVNISMEPPTQHLLKEKTLAAMWPATKINAIGHQHPID